MKNRPTLFALVAAMTLAMSGLAFAHGGGGMDGGSMMGSSGMMVVADDGSLLVTNMNMKDMSGGGGSDPVSRELINISPNGTERWRVDFTDGWPMTPATKGNLVVVVLVNDGFMGTGGIGDGGWNGGGMGGGMMGITAQDAESQKSQVTVVGLDLATGQENWRTTLNGDMASMIQLSPDGSQIYISLMDMGTIGNTGPNPMRQGDAARTSLLGSATIVALDANDGHQLWTYDAGSTGGTGRGMGRGMSIRRVR